jgi:transposase
MDEEKVRLLAIQKHLNGETPKAICSELNRSKHWFFKWLKRFRQGETDWYKDKSRAPRRRPTTTNKEVKEHIITTRNRLESERFAQIGVSAIKWELTKAKLEFPSDRTINRILHREGLVKKSLHTCPKALNTPISKRPWALTTFIRQTL